MTAPDASNTFAVRFWPLEEIERVLPAAPPRGDQRSLALYSKSQEFLEAYRAMWHQHERCAELLAAEKRFVDEENFGAAKAASKEVRQALDERGDLEKEVLRIAGEFLQIHRGAGV